jgi:N-sulfoglucosamine sulfohydrolase
MIRNDRWKLLHNSGFWRQSFEGDPEFELYDLENDPYETKNLAGDPAYEDQLNELKDQLYAFQKRTRDPWIVKWKHE